MATNNNNNQDNNNNLQTTPISTSTTNPKPNNGEPLTKSTSPEDFILSVASNIANQALQYSDPDVWGVLTAISTKARQRRQGINMLLTKDEHVIGRTVADSRFQILSNQISQQHCRIYRKKVTTEDEEGHRLFNCGFLRDTSTNGTYLNWEKLNKNSPESKLHHGDIISFAAPPQHEVAYAFVFREVLRPTSGTDSSSPLKRKADEFGSEPMRLRGIGIGSSEGPISLDDFRSLQRSNTDLRKQLEDQVATIEQLRNEHRTATELHEAEKKNLKESISQTYVDELKEMRSSLEAKQKELVEVNKISSEQKYALEDLNERHNALVQSCTEADEIMRSQKATIIELKNLLDEEREQRKEDREKAVANLTASIQRVKTEAQEELKRLSDASLRRENEQQEIINKLQESEKERCLLVETLRSKLEDTRQKLVGSDNKVRQLESQLSQEQQISSVSKKRVQELEHETSRLRKELESEKAAREEAWAKVSALEFEINGAMRDLDCEKRKLKAARERIMLRETQLRSFYSTTEEISSLFSKQQEQLKLMQRTLEDEENYENISVDINPNIDNGNRIDSIHQSKEANGSQCSGSMKAADSSTSTKTRGENQVETLNEEASVTEKHDCDARNQEPCEETQEAEFTSGEPSAKGAFGSDIDAGHTAPIGTEQILGTEQIMETETQGHDQNVDLNKLAGDTMVIDDDDEEGVKVDNGENLYQSKDPVEEDTEAGDAIRTADLLASEVIGSWACSTAPSCHGDNESLGSGGFDKGNRGGAGGGGGVLHDSACIAAESQTGGGRNLEHEALTTMIGIVAPEMKGQFGGTIESDSDKAVASNSDTEDCTEDEDGESDAEIQGRHSPSHNDNNVVELMDEDDDDGDQEETQPDSP